MLNARSKRNGVNPTNISKVLMFVCFSLNIERERERKKDIIYKYIYILYKIFLNITFYLHNICMPKMHVMRIIFSYISNNMNPHFCDVSPGNVCACRTIIHVWNTMCRTIERCVLVMFF